MERNIIIFDFDGTLADTFEFALTIHNEILADEFRVNKVLPHEVEFLRGKPAHEVLNYLHISKWKLAGMLFKGKQILNQRITSIRLFAGLKEVLLQLRWHGYRLGILTTNSQENVLAFLKHHGIDLFDFIVSESKFFGKATRLKRLLKNQCIFPQEAIYVGDETRDIESSKENQVLPIAVSWGFNSTTVLQHHQPYRVVNTPAELLPAIHSLRIQEP